MVGSIGNDNRKLKIPSEIRSHQIKSKRWGWSRARCGLFRIPIRFIREKENAAWNKRQRTTESSLETTRNHTEGRCTRRSERCLPCHVTNDNHKSHQKTIQFTHQRSSIIPLDGCRFSGQRLVPILVGSNSTLPSGSRVVVKSHDLLYAHASWGRPVFIQILQHLITAGE